jgi:C_GCAxxG_C_C family probable redox protein
VQVVHEAWGCNDDAMLRAGMLFYGGIAGHQEGPCGAISGLSIALGFRYRDSSGNPEKAQKAHDEAEKKANEIIEQFKEKFGSIICRDLVGVDFSQPDMVEKFMENPDNRDRCPGYVRFIVEKLIEMD